LPRQVRAPTVRSEPDSTSLGLRTTTDEGTVRSENAVNPLWAAAPFVVAVVRRAGRIVAGVNREHGISTFAESILRLL
jgi:hypothetical protein